MLISLTVAVHETELHLIFRRLGEVDVFFALH